MNKFIKENNIRILLNRAKSEKAKLKRDNELFAALDNAKLFSNRLIASEKERNDYRLVNVF